MFEDSLVESRVRHASASERWTTIASVSLQCALAGLVIALPLLHPEALSYRIDSPRVLVPLPPKPPVPVVRVQHVSTSSDAPSVPQPALGRTMARPLFLPSLDTSAGDAPPMTPVHFGSGVSDGLPNGLGIGEGHGSAIIVAPLRSTPLRVSSGISQGMLLTPIRPLYPAIARAAGVQGTVVVEAVISRAGTIESLRVLSGPPMLQQAAKDAIRAARYQPYRLNGEAIAVQTTITVNFRMGG